MPSEEIRMPIDPWRPLNPGGGEYFLIFERRFRYLVQDPEHTIRIKWLPVVLACPICTADAGLRMGYQSWADAFVQAQCPAGHIWGEPRVDVHYWVAYCEIQAGIGGPNDLWLIETGFGQEPPPPIDYAAELGEATTYLAKYAKRRAKARVKKAVRSPLRKAKRQMVNQAMRPVAAVLRGAWMWQAGGMEPVKQARQRTPRHPKTPPLSAYRKAYGMQAPKKGPKCLVCKDSRRITAPGISIPCTECRSPAAAAMAAAERRADKAFQGKTGGRARVGNHGIIVGPGEKIDGPVRVTGGGAGAEEIRREVADAQVHTGVTNLGGGRITGTVQQVVVHGDNQQVIVNKATGSGRPMTAKDAKAARSAMEAADRAIREAGGRSGTTVRVHGQNNSVITSVTDGDQKQQTGGRRKDKGGER
jgi:hypothetical protein